MNGHQVLSSVHTIDAPSTDSRLIEAGADDYIANPFQRRKLLARAKRFLRQERWAGSQRYFYSAKQSLGAACRFMLS